MAGALFTGRSGIGRVPGAGIGIPGRSAENKVVCDMQVGLCIPGSPGSITFRESASTRTQVLIRVDKIIKGFCLIGGADCVSAYQLQGYRLTNVRLTMINK